MTRLTTYYTAGLALWSACLWSVTSGQQAASCQKALDMVVLMDGSNSVGQANFDLMTRTVSDAMGALEFGPDKARVGAVLYSFLIDSTIELTDSLVSFRNQLANFLYPDEATYTDKAIHDTVRWFCDNYESARK